MFEVNYCLACNYCGFARRFEDEKVARDFYETVKPFCSYIHFGAMPDGIGVAHYPNPDVAPEWRGVFGQHARSLRLVAAYEEAVARF